MEIIPGVLSGGPLNVVAPLSRTGRNHIDHGLGQAVQGHEQRTHRLIGLLVLQQLGCFGVQVHAGLRRAQLLGLGERILILVWLCVALSMSLPTCPPKFPYAWSKVRPFTSGWVASCDSAMAFPLPPGADGVAAPICSEVMPVTARVEAASSPIVAEHGGSRVAVLVHAARQPLIHLIGEGLGQGVELAEIARQGGVAFLNQRAELPCEICAVMLLPCESRIWLCPEGKLA